MLLPAEETNTEVEMHMFGGLKKSTSRLALAAAASVLALPAYAADLGGNCCADLEERVAELEATTARKGNRRVSLTVSGHVNEAVMFWDDGGEQNVYVESNNDSRTRFRFVGEAKITSDWSAGYLLEIGVRYANSGNRNQTTPRAGGDLNQIDIRHSAWWVNPSIGVVCGLVKRPRRRMASPKSTWPTRSSVRPPDSWNGGFFLRNTGGGQAGLALQQGTQTGITWNQITPSFIGNWNNDGDRQNIVRYVSPTWNGFVYSSAWGEDDIWDVALRYAGEHHGFRFAAGIGYRQINDNFGKNGGDGILCADLSVGNLNESSVDCNTIGLSASIMHIATGLYVSGAWSRTEDENRQALFNVFGNEVNVDNEDECGMCRPASSRSGHRSARARSTASTAFMIPAPA